MLRLESSVILLCRTAENCEDFGERRAGSVSLRRKGLIAGLAAVIAAVAWARCGRGPDGVPSHPTATPIEDQVARELAAAHFAEDRMEEARAALAPLLTRQDPDAEDLIRAAVVELALKQRERARTLLASALKAVPDSPAVHYNLGTLARADGDLKAASERFSRAHELAPDDYPTHLALANTLADLDESAAEPHYRELLKRGLDFGGSWYLTTLYRLSRILFQSNKTEEARELLKKFSELQDSGLSVPSVTDLERGRYGRLEPPRPEPGLAVPAGPPPAFAATAIVSKKPGASGILALDLVGDWRAGRIGPPDLLLWGASGIRTLTREKGAWASRGIFDRPVALVRALDLDEDGDLDLWVVTGSGVSLLVAGDKGFTPWKAALPQLPSPPADLEPVDFDHDGDLDLLLVGGFGATLWRNDGVAQGGRFSDVGKESGLPQGRPFDWCLTEDLDTDQDVDLLLGGRGGVFFAENLRGGRFRERPDVLPAGLVLPTEPIVADLDGDGRPDLRTTGEPARLLRGAPGGKLVLDDSAGGPAVPPNAATPVDANLDGVVDLWSSTPPWLAGAVLEGAPSAMADVDGDLVPDLVGLGHEGVVIAPGVPAGRKAFRLALLGTKDNRRGVGAVVEVRAGRAYRRIYWRGEPEVIGLGGQTSADWLRVIWPNGVAQTVVDVPAGTEWIVEQREGIVGSCPFVYTWNGARYEFVTDALGIAPLGFPMAPGELIPFDHDEYVLLRGEQLVPRGGFYDIQFTEELREVTYLDRVRLDVVDHPAGSEIYPNERFTPPPFPEPHVHTVVSPLTPIRALGSDGRDWVGALRAIDLDFAAPFAPYTSLRASSPPWGGKFQGLAPRHTLELTFDRQAVRAAGKLRLILTGWFYETDSSVNIAASRTPGMRIVMPVLQAPDGRGGWRDTGPSIGIPAGKNASMVVDVTGLLSPQDPRLRIVSTLRLYWDSIRLAVDADDAPLRTTSLEPTSARLWERGFSEIVEMFGEHRLERFDWDHLAAHPRWDQHPGLYTRLGEVLPLLTGIDDRYVVMGAGDALHLRFDASALPALPDGWRRDFLLFLDGWAKDRDPNSVEALHVEPLPFHAMSGYPYRADEAFPDDSEHRAWRLEWQTRPTRRWVQRLAASGPAAPMTPSRTD